jgi:hypothetical protein
MKSRPYVWPWLLIAVLFTVGAFTGTSWAQTGTTSTPPASPDTVNTSAPATTPPASSTPTSTPAAAQPTTPPPAQAEATSAPKRSGPFSKGTTRGSLTAGWGRSFGQDYLMVGAGLGRYLRNGLEMGLSYEAWFGSDPSVSKLTPEIRMVLARAQRIMVPYVGAFYRRTFIGDNVDDLNSVGARAGIYKSGGRSYLGFGGVWEKYLDCDESIYEDCTTFYPEGSVGVTF